LSRKSQFALIALLVAAILGAFTSSMIAPSAFQLSDVTIKDIEGFKIFADQITITGGPPSMAMGPGSINGTTVVVMNSSKVEILNMHLVKDNLQINATRAVGVNVVMNVMSVGASNATFTNLTITDIPAFVQSANGTVTLENVEITAVYMFAETMTMWGMKLAAS
jgi:hypothetical protein